MTNKNSSRWQKLEASLSKELPYVIEFFTESTGLDIAVPSFKLSKDVQDVEWYTDNTIFINPTYMPKNEKISYRAMLAHGYFHHVQYVLFKFYENEDLKKKIEVNLGPEKLFDLINNFVESSAMFFAATYVTKELQGSTRTNKVIKYLKAKAYTPPKGKFYGGNEVVLLAYSENNYNIKRTLRQILSLSGSARIMKTYLKFLD